MYNRPLPDNLKNEFETIFKRSIFSFYNSFWGFDIVFFDECLNTPDGTSTKNHIIDKYGIRAANLITELIKWH